MQSKGNQEQDQDGHRIVDEQDPHPLTQGVKQKASMRHSDGDVTDEQDPHPLTQGVTQKASMRHSD